MKRVALIAGVLVALAVIFLSLRAVPVAALRFAPKRQAKSTQVAPLGVLPSESVPTPNKKGAQAPVQPSAQHRLCVRQRGGEAIPELGLSLYCSDSSALLARVQTDEQGCVGLSLCPGEETVTCVRLPAGRFRQSEAWVVDPKSDASTFVAVEARAIWGKIQDSKGTAVAGAKLWIEAADPDPLSPPLWTQNLLHSDAQGRYRWQAATAAPCDPCLVDAEDCEVSRGQLGLDAPQAGQFWIRHEAFDLQRVEIPDHWGELDTISLAPARAAIELRLLGLAKGLRVTVLLEHSQRRLDRQSQTIAAGQAVSFRGLGSGLYNLSVYQQGKRVAQRNALPAGERLEIELKRGP